MGGVGKSALAIHVAHRLTPQFPDAQLYVDLRGQSEFPLEPQAC
jgi:predicted ATPase